jgi:dihydroorotase
MFDLLIQSGNVVDPAQGLNGIMDVAVKDGRIAAVMENIPVHGASKVIDASGKIVVPGLIDLHTHVYDGVLDNGVRPDDAGVNQGVTTVADAGSAGCAIFGGFPKYLVPAARTTVYCFLHLCAYGLSTLPELCCRDEIQLDAMEKKIRSHADLIKGVKLRLAGKLVAAEGIEILKMAQGIAKKCGLPLMVHIGDRACEVSPSLTRDCLPLLERGDIVSHIYTGQFGGVLAEDGGILPAFTDAMKRGVVLDVANGRYNFAYRVARTIMAKGILPTTLSTDITSHSLGGPVYGLTVTMSKFLELGTPFESIIAMTTIHPARVLGIDHRKGNLRTGADADVSILEILSGAWSFPDSDGEMLDVKRRISPFLTIKAGVPIPPSGISIGKEDLTQPHKTEGRST